MRGLVIGLALALAGLPGCVHGGDTGTIHGLLVDEVYRPIPQALIVAEPGNHTARADMVGQFTFRDLPLGTYVLRANAEGYLGAPMTVDVLPDDVADVEIYARRLDAFDAHLHHQTTLFLACSAEAGAVASSGDCPAVGPSGESRTTLSWQLPRVAGGVGAVLTEVQVDPAPDNATTRYAITLENIPADHEEVQQYASGEVVGRDVLRLVLRAGQVSPDHTHGENAAWKPVPRLRLVVTPVGAAADEGQAVLDAQCGVWGPCQESHGVGAQFAVRVIVAQTAFPAPAPSSLDDYVTLA